MPEAAQQRHFDPTDKEFLEEFLVSLRLLRDAFPDDIEKCFSTRDQRHLYRALFIATDEVLSNIAEKLNASLGSPKFRDHVFEVLLAVYLAVGGRDIGDDNQQEIE